MFKKTAEPKSVWTFIHPDRSVKLQLGLLTLREHFIHLTAHPTLKTQTGSPHFNHHNSRYSKQRFEISQDAMLVSIAIELLDVSAINKMRGDNSSAAWNRRVL